MMTLIKLHPEVVKFLTECGTVYTDASGIEAFIVNDTMYTETDEKGYYVTTSLVAPPKEDTYEN